jgi:hypothetical protein
VTSVAAQTANRLIARTQERNQQMIGITKRPDKILTRLAKKILTHLNGEIQRQDEY